MNPTLLAVISLATSLSTIVTVLIVLWQTIVARRVAQFQSYLGLHSIAEGTSLREGITILNSLPTYTDYQTFLETEAPETRKAIYGTVSFLNVVAHLVSEGYLDKYQAWSRYFFCYRLCYDKLYPWYTQGLRDTRFGGEKVAYSTFEAMCDLVHEADKSEAVKNKLLKRQRKRLGLPANKYTSLIHLLMRMHPHRAKGISQDGKGFPESPNRETPQESQSNLPFLG